MLHQNQVSLLLSCNMLCVCEVYIINALLNACVSKVLWQFVGVCVYLQIEKKVSICFSTYLVAAHSSVTVSLLRTTIYYSQLVLSFSVYYVHKTFCLQDQKGKAPIKFWPFNKQFIKQDRHLILEMRKNVTAMPFQDTENWSKSEYKKRFYSVFLFFFKIIEGISGGYLWVFYRVSTPGNKTYSFNNMRSVDGVSLFEGINYVYFLLTK